jgi:hypothetical protein
MMMTVEAEGVVSDVVEAVEDAEVMAHQEVDSVAEEEMMVTQIHSLINFHLYLTRILYFIRRWRIQSWRWARRIRRSRWVR